MIPAHRLGLVVGGVTGASHLGWSMLILLGWAQPFIDWIFKLHMIEPIYRVQPFRAGAAILLVSLTCLFGYFLGFLAGWLWNNLFRSTNS